MCVIIINNIVLHINQNERFSHVNRVPLTGNGHKQLLNGGETGFTGEETMFFLLTDISYNMNR